MDTKSPMATQNANVNNHIRGLIDGKCYFLPQMTLVHVEHIQPTPLPKKENMMPPFFFFAIEPDLVKILTKLGKP